VTRAATQYGSQAVVASIDARRNFWNHPRAFINGGKKQTRFRPEELAQNAERLGAGEIFLTAINREGSFSGYDLDLLKTVTHNVGIPVIANGGAGSIEHFRDAVEVGCSSAVAAGSMFVFAARDQGVLINYPPEVELRERFWMRVGEAVAANAD